jgi:uncharacterized protein YpmS
MNKPKKYNGFWKWFFISELILIIIIFISLEILSKASINHKNTNCASAFNCKTYENDNTILICDYCKDEDCTPSNEKVICPKNE